MTFSMTKPFTSVLLVASSSLLLISGIGLVGCSSSNVQQETNKPTRVDSAQNKSVAAEASDEEAMQSDAIAENSVQSASGDERLGTKWGDEVDSVVTTVDLRRVSENPIEQMQVFYADKNYSGRTLNSMSMLAGKVNFSIATDNGALPLFRNSNKYYVRGQSGQAYQLVYSNDSDKTYEVVASVDGLDVIDGSAASRYSSGYVLSPHESLIIEGFRKNDNAVASFIFSKPTDSYAANSEAGSINNTGVIGTVFYELYDPNSSQSVHQSGRQPQQQSGQPQAFPGDNGYAKPPK